MQSSTALPVDETSDVKKQVVYYLPDTLRDWPWPRRINPHYEEVKAESTAWLMEVHSTFDQRSQAKFEAASAYLLACLAYPWLNKEHIRTACDMMVMFYLFDEYSDVVDGKEARQQADAILDGMRNPDKSRSKDDVLGEAMRQFWKLGLATATPQAAKRFEESWTDYVHAVVDQARDRDINRVRNIKDYISLRRSTIGARPSYALLELPLAIPDEVWKNDLIEEMTVASIDMIILGNDMVSYNVEQARGDDAHNIIRVVMEEKNIDLEGALQWAEKYYSECRAIFLNNRDKLPSWGEKVDADVKQYIDGLGNWVRADTSWSFESGRYFGNKGMEISKHRRVELLPKKKN